MEMTTIALIGFIIIVTILFWSVSQIGIGRQGIVISQDISEADKAISGIEGQKRTLKDSLVFSSNIASLQIALAGGSYGGERSWWCNGQPTPPELDEVLWSLSNKTGALYKVYYNKVEKIVDYDIGGYQCIKINYPEECKTSSCAIWNATAIDGNISYSGKDLKVFYDGSIETDTKPNRFWWMYFRLYDYAKEKKFDLDIPNCVPFGTPLEVYTDSSLKESINEIEALFDGYVFCSYAYECKPGSQCETYCADEFNQKLCYNKESNFISNELTTFTITTENEEKIIDSAKVSIKCTDRKYRIPDEEKFKELTWIIKATVIFRYSVCPTTTLPPTLPPVTQPPVTLPPVTQPPKPPTTLPPVTAPPVTQPPVTQPPITQPPITNPPVTQPPQTLPPTLPPTTLGPPVPV